MLGFQGRYHDADDPERQALLTALNARVVPFVVSQSLVTQPAGSARRHALRWLHVPALHIAVAALLLAGVWWWLEQRLAGALAVLLPGQG